MTLLFFKPQFLFGMPGGTEWILIVLIVLLFFGGRKIPELMRGIGKGVKEFTDAKGNMKSEIDAGSKEKDATPVTENREAIKQTEVRK